MPSNQENFDEKFLPLLEHSEQLSWIMKTILRNSTDEIFAKDRDRKFIYANPAAYAHMKKKNTEVIGKTMLEIFGPGTSTDIVNQSDKRVLEQGESVTTEIVLDDKIYEVKKNPFYDNQGKVLGLIGYSRDVTAERKSRKALEYLLKELEAKSVLLQTILDQMPVGLLVAEAPKGRLFIISDRMNLVSREGKDWPATIHEYGDWVGYHPDGRRYQAEDWPIHRALTKGEVVVNEETRVLRGDGTPGIIQFSSAPVRDSQGQIIAAITIGNDITEYKKALEELKKAKEAAESANQMKSAFLANMSHEIRTPLGAILGFTELIKDPSTSEEDKKNYIETIARNGAQLHALINDILDLSKIESNYMTMETVPFSLRSVIEDVMSIMRLKADAKGLILQVDIPEDAPDLIESDPTRFKQILTNIVGNAVKFTSTGKVSLKVSLNDIETAAPRKKILVLEVQDTGIGISSEQAGRLFKTFSQVDESMTRRYGGTGLGLALSKRLAQILGGDVILKSSAPGKGSIFQITLTVDVIQDVGASPPVKSPQPKQKGPADFPLLGAKVLLVEDSTDNQALFMRILTNKGAKVTLANNGLEGIEAAIGNGHDLILMDIQMPVLDGYEATRELRARGYRKPIIALTAHAFSEIRQKCLDAGFTDHIVKPVRGDDMVKAILRYLSAYRG